MAKPLISKDVPDLPMAKPAGTIERFGDNGNCHNGEANGASGPVSPPERAFQVRIRQSRRTKCPDFGRTIRILAHACKRDGAGRKCLAICKRGSTNNERNEVG
jgi:hypothetical protein